MDVVVATVATAVAWLVIVGLRQIYPEFAFLYIFMAAVALLTYMRGWVASLLSVLGAAVGAAYLTFPPIGSPVTDIAAVVPFALFVATTGGTAIAAWRLRQAVSARAEVLERELRSRAAAEAAAQDRELAVRALRASETQLRLVTDTIPALIAYVDTQQRYRFNSRGYQEWFGLAPQRLQGRHVREVIGEAAYALMSAHIETALAGRDVTFEADVPYGSGPTRPVQITYSPDRDERGQVRGFVATVMDISLRREAEAERARLLEAERQARAQLEAAVQRTERLQRLTAAFAQAQTAAEITNALYEHVDTLPGVLAVAVGLLRPESQELDVIPPESVIAMAESWRHIPLTLDIPLAEAARTNLPILVGTDGRRLAWVEATPRIAAADGVAYAALPLRAEGRPIGALGFTFTEGRVLDADHRDILTALTDLAAGALARAQAYDAERRARAEAENLAAKLRDLQMVVEAPVAELAEDDLLKALLVRTRDFIQADTAAILLLDPRGETLVARATVGLEEEVERRVRIPVGRGFAGRVVSAGRPLVIPDVDVADVVDPLLREKGIKTLLGVPLAIEGRALGVLHVGTLTPRDFNARDVRLLQLIANRVALAIENTHLYQSERQARGEAEAARERLAFLLRASTDLAASLDTESTLMTIARLVIPMLADMCTVDILKPDGATRRLVVHGDPSKAQFAQRLQEAFPVDIGAEQHPIARVLRTGQPILMPEITERGLAAGVRHPEHLRLLSALGVESSLIVPLVVAGRVVGSLTLDMAGSGRRYTEADLALVQDLARRAALALEHAQAYEHERHLVELFQRGLLPQSLPVMPGVAIASRYFPGSSGVEIGGDWYDAFMLPDGQIGLAIGDVVGKGVAAATLMGQMRNALRALALREDTPAAVVRALNEFSFELPAPRMATLVYLVFDRITGRVRYVNAGHPHPLIIHGGVVAGLDGGGGLPLGVVREASYAAAETRLAAGAALLLYTDGLVERRGRTLEEGLARLYASITAWPGNDLEALLDQAIAGGRREGAFADDVALLALHAAPVGAELHLQMPADLGSLRTIRHSVRRWLTEAAIPDGEVFDILVAVGEATANAIEHAYGPAGGEIVVRARRDAEIIELSVEDSGRWRPPRGRYSGRGLKIMQALMDEVSIDHSDRGTIVRMRRRLRQEAKV